MSRGGYGIEWNATNAPQYGGNGRGGQILWVWPDLDMIIVSNAGGNGGQLGPMLRAAVKSEQPLPANAEGDAQLKKASADAVKPPTATPVPALPATAAAISGNVYTFPVNSSRLDSLSLTFAANGSATANIRYYGQPLSFPVGLDGIYRVGKYGPLGLPAGAMGKWTSDNEFLLDLNFIANINHYTLAIKFTPEKTIEVIMETKRPGLMRNGHLVGTLAAK